MDRDDLCLSPVDCDRYLLSGVVDATCPPNEPPDAAKTRSAAINTMFRTFKAADAMEAMVACHCITLRFLLESAMRDAGNTNLDPVVLAKTRAAAMSISKTLHLWMGKFEAIHTRNETSAAEARQPGAKPSPARPAAPPEPTLAPTLAPLAVPDRPKPIAPAPTTATPPPTPKLPPDLRPSQPPLEAIRMPPPREAGGLLRRDPLASAAIIPPPPTAMKLTIRA
jgi:hypothetical protein